MATPADCNAAGACGPPPHSCSGPCRKAAGLAPTHQIIQVGPSAAAAATGAASQAWLARPRSTCCPAPHHPLPQLARAAGLQPPSLPDSLAPRPSPTPLPSHPCLQLARGAGFDNVHDFLVHQATGEGAEAIAARKPAHAWGAWLAVPSDPAPAATAEEEEDGEEEEEGEEAVAVEARLELEAVGGRAGGGGGSKGAACTGAGAALLALHLARVCLLCGGIAKAVQVGTVGAGGACTRAECVCVCGGGGREGHPRVRHP